MINEEKNERFDIFDGEKRIGCVSVRYPFFSGEYKKINLFYENLASSYIRFAEKRIPKIKTRINTDLMISCVFFCRVGCSDEEYISVRCEARTYIGNERSASKCFSNVWCLPKCRLAYKRRYGMRCSNVAYDGKEVYLFDK